MVTPEEIAHAFGFTLEEIGNPQPRDHEAEARAQFAEVIASAGDVRGDILRLAREHGVGGLDVDPWPWDQ